MMISVQINLAVRKTILFVLSLRPLPRGGSGLSISSRIQVFRTDSGPDPGPPGVRVPVGAGTLPEGIEIPH